MLKNQSNIPLGLCRKLHATNLLNLWGKASRTILAYLLSANPEQHIGTLFNYDNVDQTFPWNRTGSIRIFEIETLIQAGDSNCGRRTDFNLF